MKTLVLTLTAFVAFGLGSPLHAQKSKTTESVGTLEYLTGKVLLRRASERGARPILKPPQTLYLGDTITTDSKALARIRLADGSLYMLSGDSELTVTRFLFDKAKRARTSWLSLLKGTISAVIKKLRLAKNDVRITTPSAIAGVRGTSFQLRSRGSTTWLTVVSGLVQFSNYQTKLRDQAVEVRARQHCSVRGGSPPTKPITDLRIPSEQVFQQAIIGGQPPNLPGAIGSESPNPAAPNSPPQATQEATQSLPDPQSQPAATPFE